MYRVSDNELFEITYVGNEQDIDQKKCEYCDILGSFRKWNDLSVHIHPSRVSTRAFHADSIFIAVILC